MARYLKGINASKADLEREIMVRKEVEESLRMSEERYRSLFSGMTEGFALHEIMLDENGKPCDYLFLDINPAFEKLTGLDRADVIGKTHNEILPEDSAKWVEIYGRVALTGEPVRFDNYSPELKKHFEVFSYRPAPLQFVTFFVDITDRKHQEEKIAKLTNLYQVLSRVNEATARIRDPISLYCEVCRIIAEIGCFPLVWIGEFRGSNLVPVAWSGTASDSLKGLRQDLQGDSGSEPTATTILENRAIVDEFLSSAAFPLQCHGTVVGAITLHSAQPNRFDGEQICLLESLSQDLSHALDAIFEEKLRLQAESELRETRDYLESLIDNANAPIIVWDPDFRITRFNHAFERMTGLLAREVLGRELDILFPEESRMVALDHIKRALSGERWETVEIPIWNTRGSVRTALWNSANICDKDGSKIVATIAQGQDITERKLIEMELFRARDELEERVRERTADLCRISQQLASRAEELNRKSEDLMRSNAELEQFAHIASHDLQEPLRMISSYVQLLSRRYKGRLDDDADEFIDYAVEGTRRMQQLIGDLLAYSRVGTRGRPLSPTSLEEALSEALANLKLAMEESGAVVTHDELPMVLADKVQIVQLFQNLIGNAIKFRSEQSPRVQISARQNEREWTISVQDNGIGIDPQFHDRIFTIFQRLHGRDEYPGTGIGLTIARKIVQRHGGRIWLESEPGHKTTFYFTMPLERQNCI